LRTQASAQGLCFARVLRAFAHGLYWADVSATSEASAPTTRVLLTEEDLYAALPYDVRVQDKSPARLLTIMAAHAQYTKPVQRMEPAPPLEVAPAPSLPIEPVATIEVSTDELQEVLTPLVRDNRSLSGLAGPMQQALLRLIIDVLMKRLYQGQDRVSALYFKVRCAVIALLARWHRQHQSSQRVVNVAPGWSEERQDVVWRLTVGIPALARQAA